MPGLATTVTIHRVGLLDLSSITDRTKPVMVAPIKLKLVFSFRNWAYRQRLASFGSVITIVCMLLPMVAVHETSSATIRKISANR
jgi:hypothetical protein